MTKEVGFCGFQMGGKTCAVKGEEREEGKKGDSGKEGNAIEDGVREKGRTEEKHGFKCVWKKR